MEQLNQVTQQNAASSQELASTSNVLFANAQTLANMVQKFKTGNDKEGNPSQVEGSSTKMIES